MNKVTVLRVNGTGEHEPGMLSLVTRKLDPARFVSHTVSYPADYGINNSYFQSVEIGTAALDRAVAAVDGKVIILGYSQGATIAGNYANVHGESDKIVAVGLLADPLRPRTHHSIYGKSSGYGVAGERFIKAKFPVWQVAHHEDPICSLPDGNPLRVFADLTDYMSLRDPISWGRQVATKIATQQLKHAGDIRNFRAYGEAARFVYNYLSGKHWAPYVNGYLDALADRINSLKIETSADRQWRRVAEILSNAENGNTKRFLGA